MTTGTHDPRFRALVEQLRRHIGRRIADAHVAEDLAQEVLLKLVRQLQDGPEPDSLPAWLFRTAHNAMVDHHRGRRPQAELPDELSKEGEHAGAATGTNEPLCAALREFLAALPDEQRDALVATAFDGLSQQDLARQLGVPLSTVKSRVQRGRKKLEQQLRDCCSFEFDRRGGLVDWRRWPDSDCPACR